MRDQVLGFNISVLIHGIVVAGLFALGQGKMFENKPIVIDLSIVSSSTSSGTAVSDRSSHQKRTFTVRKENRSAVEPSVLSQKEVLKPPPAAPSTSPPKPVSQKQPAFQKVKLVSPDRTKPKAHQTVPSKTMEDVIQASNDVPDSAPGTYDTTSHAAIKRLSAGDMAGLSTRGQVGDNPENVGQAYVNRHFTYLRELIRKHLCYPKIARKMGWDGKVLVAFTILKNGHVDDLEIRESCGIKLLDQSALKTVRMACPFPKPPTTAKIIIPIAYNLN